MSSKMRALAVLLVVVAPLLAQEAPRHVILTWRGDTGTTLLVTFQTLSDRPVKAEVYYDTVSRGGVVEDYQKTAKGKSFRIPGLGDRWIHHVELTGLKPGDVLYLCAGDPQLGISKEYKVRTIAHDERSLRFVTGGDMGPGVETRLLLRQAAKSAPDFAMVGGDVAYANGRLDAVDRWDTWLTYYTEEMVTPEGFTIPVVFAIGNHEVLLGRADKEAAPFYFGFFNQDEHSFFARRFGKNLLFLILDSGHVSPHGGEQARWLAKTLAANAGIRFKAAIYHVPLYPSHRDFMGPLSLAGRIHWAPLFDRHGLTVAFENHDHTFKRTPPLKANKVVRDGVLYLGDGCWGRPPRAVVYGGRWYLRKQASAAHFWQVDVDKSGLVYRAIDRRGRVFDVYPEDAPGAEAAAQVFEGIKNHYRLPFKAVSVSKLRCSGPTFREGTVTVRVTNPFDSPVEVHVEPYFGPQGMTVVASETTIGAHKSGKVRVKLAVPKRVPVDGLRIRVRVRLVYQPEGKRVELSDNFTVRVKPGS